MPLNTLLLFPLKGMWWKMRLPGPHLSVLCHTRLFTLLRGGTSIQSLHLLPILPHRSGSITIWSSLHSSASSLRTTWSKCSTWIIWSIQLYLLKHMGKRKSRDRWWLTHKKRGAISHLCGWPGDSKPQKTTNIAPLIVHCYRPTVNHSGIVKETMKTSHRPRDLFVPWLQQYKTITRGPLVSHFKGWIMRVAADEHHLQQKRGINMGINNQQ